MVCIAQEFAKKFYASVAWKKCRDGYFKFKYGLCERCSNLGKIVHHKIVLTQANIDNPDITLNWDNLELVCKDCHNREHLEKYSPLRHDVMFDEHGQLVKRKG